MTVKASEVKAFFDELELNYEDRGVDRDGDHIFVTGFPAKDYEDFDGKNSFICHFQLLEKRKGTSESSAKDKISELTTELLDIDPSESMDRFLEIQKELKELKSVAEIAAEYDMFAVYISQLNAKKLDRNKTLEAINNVNARVKGARLAIDSHDDVIFYYQLILEDGSFTLSQFKRLISITMTAVSEFGRAVSKE